MRNKQTVQILYDLDGNSFMRAFYSKELGNRMQKFTIGGEYKGESSFSFNHSKIREVDIVSLINVDNIFEAGYIINGEFDKIPVEVDIYTIIKWLNSFPSNQLLQVGTKNMEFKDEKGVIPYTQYLFAFAKGVLSEEKIQEVFGSNG